MNIYVLTLFISTIAISWQRDSREGIVYLSFDNGRTWENKSTGIPKDIFLSDIATEGNVVGLATKRNGIFLFDFQSDQWRPTPAVPVADDDVNVLCFHNGRMLAGTRNSGIFVSDNRGGSWASFNQGLKNLTIRKFAVARNGLYVGTDGGLYVFDSTVNQWRLEFGRDALQVNGIVEFQGEVYIGTNQGAFRRVGKTGKWVQVMNDHALHNISTDGQNLYALAYNELFISRDNGASWRSDQRGIPFGKYSFHLMEKDQTVFVGQWDGVYTRKGYEQWKLMSGLPGGFPVTELTLSGDIIVAGSSLWPK